MKLSPPTFFIGDRVQGYCPQLKRTYTGNIREVALQSFLDKKEYYYHVSVNGEGQVPHRSFNEDNVKLISKNQRYLPPPKFPAFRLPPPCRRSTHT